MGSSALVLDLLNLAFPCVLAVKNAMAAHAQVEVDGEGIPDADGVVVVDTGFESPLLDGFHRALGETEGQTLEYGHRLDSTLGVDE